MKKSSIVLSLLVWVSTVAFCMEVDKPSSYYGIAVMKKGSVYNLHYKSEKLENVTVKIFNSHNLIVYTETLRKVDSFIRPYNLSDAEQGQYVITIEDSNGKHIEYINPKRGNIEKLAGVVKLSKNDNKYVLSVPNKGIDNLTIQIYDGSGIEVHTETVAVNGDFAKIYNLNKVSGAYTFVITDANGATRTIQY